MMLNDTRKAPKVKVELRSKTTWLDSFDLLLGVVFGGAPPIA